jgi:Na+:H+ antiporter, NhaA family
VRLVPPDVRGGVALLAAAAVALGVANSPHGPLVAAFWRGDVLWHRALLGPWFGLSLTPQWIVADLLMPVFFFSVGLELRGELRHGVLSHWRRAALPLGAAMGGMLVPAVVYLGMARAPELRAGWGVPIATDIAFALGVLALLGRRVPNALRVLLLALAVIDDLGAVVIIALFYAKGVSIGWLAFALLGLALVYWLQRRGVRSWLAYVPGAVSVWLGCYGAGLHPTLAGVALGLLVMDAPHRGTHTSEAVAAHLKPWVDFLVMPVFALANAGVTLSAGSGGGAELTVSLGIGLALLLGKPLGVLTMTGLWVKLGLARMPAGVGVRELVVLGSVAGIGFTMALFVAQLAFSDRALLEAAKLGVVAASAGAALGALGLGYALLPRACASDETALTAKK